MTLPQKVLIADDNEASRLLLKALISLENNFLVDEAKDGKEAFEKINKSKPNLLILELMLSGQTGIELTENIKENPCLKDIKVIILSNRKEDANWALAAGADFFVAKPYDPIKLLDQIKNLK